MAKKEKTIVLPVVHPRDPNREILWEKGHKVFPDRKKREKKDRCRRKIKEDE